MTVDHQPAGPPSRGVHSTHSSLWRDADTVRTACGVRLSPDHILSRSFRTWTSESTLTTWCGIDTDTAQGAHLTTDLVSCLTCPEASWRALRDDGR
jgi:hypothetical protein